MPDSLLLKTEGAIIFDRNVKLQRVKTISKFCKVVLLNKEFEEQLTDVVMPDDIGGVESGVDYLFSKGHRRIGFFALKATEEQEDLNIHSYRRLDGFYNTGKGELAELFDLAKDRHEYKNVFYEPKYRDARESLLRRLLQWWVQTQQPVNFSRKAEDFPSPRWYK